MNFAQLVAEVYVLTNRPDLVAETESAVRAATLKLHGLDFFYPDIVEVQIAFPTAEYIQQLDYISLFPLWRAVKYLRVLDTSANPPTPSKFITLIQPEFVIDEYHDERLDVMYAAGNYLNIKMSTEEATFLLGYYSWPNITSASYSSWIADRVPWAIINEAASQVFKSIGYDEQYTRFQTLNAEHLVIVKANGIVAQGY